MLREEFHPSPWITPPPEVVAYDEFFDKDLRPRDHYAAMWEHIRQTGQDVLETKSREAQLRLYAEGVGFRMHAARSEDAARPSRFHPMPRTSFDLVPRIVTSDEWETIETGLRQRVRALNLFLKDVYGRQEILKDGVVPPALIYDGKDFRRELMDVVPPGDVYIHVSGIDLIRDEGGRYLVLEDNLRTPSGAREMVENRTVERRVLPELFARYRVRPVEQYPDLLLRALRSLSPRGEARANILVLHPGVFDSSYYELGFLAKAMGVPLVAARDLLCRDAKLYRRTESGLQRVDVIYRGLEDDRLDPALSKRGARLGIAGLVDAWRAGNITIANAPGTGIADDKAVYAYVPDIIRYYLGEAPILDNVPTYQMTDCQDQAFTLDNLERMVVKAVTETDGELLMGPLSTPAQRAELQAKIRENPRNYIAQPVIQLSRHLCYQDGELEARHLDLRPFVIYGRDIEVIPGGLTRVATGEGSLVVSSAQSLSKDTWVLAD